ncbi:MAG TPA: GGDEF domain-containing protein [Acidimicrobiales bacterium]
MRWRPPVGFLLIAAVLVAVGTGATPSPAVAQTQPPPSPPPTQPGQPGPGQTLPPPQPGGGTRDDATVRIAAIALAQEASALVALRALTPPGSDRLASALGPVGIVGRVTDPAELTRLLHEGDEAGANALRRLGGGLSRDVQTTLSLLSAADREAASAGRAVSLDAEEYLRGLDHLARNAGAPPASAVPPDPAAIAAYLAGQSSTSVPPTGGGGDGVIEQRADEETDGDGDGDGDGGSSSLVPILAAVVAVLGAGAAFAFTRRRGPLATPAASPATATRPLSTQPPQSAMQDLLEVSRRLTSAAATGDIDRAVLRDALGLVWAQGAALVRQAGDVLTVSAETQPDLLRTEGLDAGAIRRVAETGQPLVQISATEPAVRNLPASLAAFPLVGGGRVEAVLVLLRSESQPFTASERDVLQALAPVAAAALHSARQTRSAIEESLVDPLTGVGNRRRFDAELATAVAEHVPAALFICDLDHFKSVNDQHGHPAGDALLRSVAALVRDTVRPGDSVYRFGGEEFCCLLRETALDAAVAVAERVRAAIAERAFAIGKPEPLHATASFGVSVSTDGDAPGLLARADAALYEAKEGGRNQVRAGR